MFKDLRAGTKFLILCGVSLVLTSVATYAFLVEKQIAISFARSELVGSKYLALLRPIYAAELKAPTNDVTDNGQTTSEVQSIDSLLRADTEAPGILHIRNIVEALASTLRDLQASKSRDTPANDPYSDSLKHLRELAAQIGDDSKITLDPVLDTYHLGNIVVIRFPTALEQLGQAELLAIASKTGTDSVDHKARLIALDTLLRANLEGMTSDLRSAQREDHDGRLKQFVEPALISFAASASTYLDALHILVNSGAAPAQLPSSYGDAVKSALETWHTTQKHLEQLLMQRIDGLHYRRLLSLVLIGILGTLGVLVALLTYRDMIVPIKRLAELANSIRETKNYGLRFNYESRDEIGRLGGAFNEMLGELSLSREREIMGQAEIARVSRLATMGAMVASIAHEIRQPLAAVVANSHAGTRWLAREKPNLDEARAALESIGENGHRANEVITSISAMFKKNPSRRTPVEINKIINDVLNLSRGELGSRKITLTTKLSPNLPCVFADPVQLTEVLLNLIMNAAEAMSTTADNSRILRIVSMLESDGVKVTVEDSGIGIDAKNNEQIFEAFFTTKPTGMGMGLAICRSIIVSHGGRLWASPGSSCGTIFHVFLPLGSEETRATG
jgi:signal transduction histidine kinase